MIHILDDIGKWMKTTEAIANYLELFRAGAPEHGIEPHNDPSLLDRWSPAMETQLQADPSAGDETDIKGVYEDKDGNRFWNVRLPKNAGTVATFEDRPIGFAPVKFSREAGMTGWNHQEKVSKFCGFDFDAIAGHAEGVGISGDELERVKLAAFALPYIEVRRSTSGNGFHLYAMLGDIPTANHTEHAQLARAVLAKMSADAGHDFASQVDACGGNMWFASKRATQENGGFSLVKAATTKLIEADLPAWRVEQKQEFPQVELSPRQRRDIETLNRSTCPPQFVREKGCYRIHTTTLHLIDTTFKTISAGNNPSQPNGFLYPRDGDQWHVERFSGAKEDPSWNHEDGRTWTVLRPPLFATNKPVRMSAKRLAEEHPTQSPVLIDGLMRLGDVANLIAAPKVGKSWLTYAIALSIATGQPLFNLPCRKGRTLLIDNELRPSTIGERLPQVARAMGIADYDRVIDEMIEVVSLRGHLLDLKSIGEDVVRDIKPGEFDCVILDAWYRANTADENSNSAVAQAFNLVDQFAAHTNAAWVLVHHTSKGDQSQKSVTDTGAGAGSQSRAADTHIVLRPHEQPDHFVLDAVVRTFRPIEPIVLRWDYPIFTVASHLDPASLASPQSKKQQQNDAAGQDRIRKSLVEPRTMSELRSNTGIGRDRIARLLTPLVNAGEVVEGSAVRGRAEYTTYQLASLN